MVKYQLMRGGMATANTRINTRYADGTSYTITVTPRGYVLDGVTFATLEGATKAAREGRRKA